jgi:hypothetical protein
MGSRMKEDERHEMVIRKLLKMPQNKRCINCDSVVSILPLFPFFGLYQYWETHAHRCTFECLSGFFMKIFLPGKSFSIYNGVSECFIDAPFLIHIHIHIQWF